ncbi:hypothetical protein HYT84_01820 [Candidatus Micrarchaeota archaeon]|nr:hypothetical protein [Candidatus Micrarchaeota archaeon]
MQLRNAADKRGLMLRAYLNRAEHQTRIIGKKVYLIRPLGEFELVRYASFWGEVVRTFRLQVKKLALMLNEIRPEIVQGNQVLPKDRITHALDELEREGVTNKGELSTLGIGNTEFIKLVDRTYSELVIDMLKKFDKIALELARSPEQNKKIFRNDLILQCLGVMWIEAAKRSEKTGRSRADVIVSKVLERSLWNLINELKSSNETLILNRTRRRGAMFNNTEDEAWVEMKKHILTGRLSLEFVGKVLDRVGRSYNAEQLLELHCRHGFVERINVDSGEFLVVSSPFAQKPLGIINKDTEIAVYPLDEEVKQKLVEIAGPSFEHANGSVALASITFRNGSLFVDELQSDLPALFRIKGVNPEGKVAQIIADWTKIIIEAIKSLVRKIPAREFYVTGPSWIFKQYGLNVNARKVTEVYFDSMVRLNGELVYFSPTLDLQPGRYCWKFQIQ